MNKAGRPPIPLEIKIARAEQPTTDVCWEWPGKRNKDGYGIVGHCHKHMLAHRVAIEIRLGRKLQTDEVVMHACDNPPCINLAHLSIGTHALNAADAAAKGRTRNQKKTHCVSGHPLIAGNLYANPDGYRVCATCQRATVKRYKERRL